VGDVDRHPHRGDVPRAGDRDVAGVTPRRDGAGGARGLKTIDLKAMKEIVISWFLTPVVAGIVSFVLYKIFSFVLKVH
jgi:hypothetical protein